LYLNEGASAASDASKILAQDWFLFIRGPIRPHLRIDQLNHAILIPIGNYMPDACELGHFQGGDRRITARHDNVSAGVYPVNAACDSPSISFSRSCNGAGVNDHLVGNGLIRHDFMSCGYQLPRHGLDFASIQAAADRTQ
jgi:hypothetical protein